MRIIAGEKRGFALFAPSGGATRPTLSRVRESMFAILGDRVIDARALDLYAGAGTLGLESLSRGAAACVFVERARPAVEALHRNVVKLEYQDLATIQIEDVGRWIRRHSQHDQPFDLVLVDPPYGSNLGQIVGQIEAHLPLAEESAIVVQCGVREPPPATACLRLARSEKYGETALHFYLCDYPSPRVG